MLHPKKRRREKGGEIRLLLMVEIRNILRNLRNWLIFLIQKKITEVLSAIITPPDIASQIIVSIPILVLYEISIIISKIGFKKLNN